MEFETKGIINFAFADDLAPSFSGLREYVTLNNTLNNWCGPNEMDIDAFKSALMFVTKKKFKQSSTPIQFPEVKHYKYLGVIIKKNGTI